MRRTWIAGIVAVGLGMVLGFAGCRSRGEEARPGRGDGGELCDACHAEQVAYWRHGGHHRIGCDVCHGVPGDHLREKIDPRPRLASKGPGHCLECHLRRAGEPAEPPRIDGLAEHLAAVEKKHAMKVDRARVGDGCAFCHEPHLLE